jgi:hypothetical protein
MLRKVWIRHTSSGILTLSKNLLRGPKIWGSKKTRNKLMLCLRSKCQQERTLNHLMEIRSLTRMSLFLEMMSGSKIPITRPLTSARVVLHKIFHQETADFSSNLLDLKMNKLTQNLISFQEPLIPATKCKVASSILQSRKKTIIF